MKRAWACVLLLLAPDAFSQQIVGFAKLDASTFEPGPTSGQFLEGYASAPFDSLQPVQGFSGVTLGPDGTLYVLADNGFGVRENSPDAVLRVFQIRPDFGTGQVEVVRSIVLRDPEHHLPFSVVADEENYPDSEIAVDARIREGRWLTGWDLDPESMQRTRDGTFWLGDEFGPFLLHVAADGVLLEAPFSLPDVHSPQNLLHRSEPPRAAASGGFEGLALIPDGLVAYPLLEKSLRGDPPGRLAVYRFDVKGREYNPRTPYRWYRLESKRNHIGDFIALDDTRCLVIERDDQQGPDARFKKIFLVDLDLVDMQGLLRKRELVDLLAVPDPERITGGDIFRMPLVTIEGLAVYDERTLCVVNDNNFPFSVGRHADTGALDDDEVVLIGFDEPLASLRVE